MQIEDALVKAKLDWEVGLEPVYLGGRRWWDDEDDAIEYAPQEIKGSYAVIQEGTRRVLAPHVGENYATVQNREMAEMLQGVVEAGEDIFVETALSMRSGRVVVILLRLDGDGYKVKGVDMIYPYMLGRNSHDGNSSLRVFPTSVRVVCANTLMLAMSKGRGQGISIQHSGDMQAKLKAAQQTLRVVKKTFETFTEQAEALASFDMDGAQVVQFVNAVFPAKDEENVPPRTKTARDALFVEVENGDDVPEVQKLDYTAWGVFNALTRYTNHTQPVKLSRVYEEKDERAEREARLNSVLFDTGNKRNQLALNYLTALSVGKDPQNIARMSA
jgi:phage/plasmid-like protein (TIGR03299 family)